MLRIPSCEKQFEKLFDEYYFRVIAFAQGFVKDHFAAEEIVQNVFLKLWFKRDVLEGISNMSAYIFKISRNEIVDYFRGKAAKSRIHMVELSSDVKSDSFSDQKLDYTILHGAIMNFISTMPEQRRKVFLMSRERNMSNAEIAKELNLSQRTVETHISKALSQLRDFLATFKILMFFI